MCKMKGVQILVLYSHTSNISLSKVSEFSTAGINRKDILGRHRERKARKMFFLLAQNASGCIWDCLDLYYLRDTCVLSHMVPGIGNNSHPKSYQKYESIP